MAKVKGPLMSVSANGAYGRAITFTGREGNQNARRWSQPSGTASPDQITQRDNYAAGVAAWNALTSGEKITWAENARPLNLTGFNLFMSQNTKPAPVTDPYWSYVTFMNNFTADADLMADATDKVITPNGAASIAAGQSKWGTKALALSGDLSCYLYLAHDAGFDRTNDDITIEGFFYATSSSSNNGLLSRKPTWSYQSLAIWLDGSDFVALSDSGSNNNWTFVTKSGLTLNAWHHFAYVISSGKGVMYLDGVGGAPVTVPNNTNTAEALYIGKNGLGGFVGYMNSLRITKGIARYLADFTPPDAPFPAA